MMPRQRADASEKRASKLALRVGLDLTPVSAHRPKKDFLLACGRCSSALARWFQVSWNCPPKDPRQEPLNDVAKMLCPHRSLDGNELSV